MEVTKFQPGSRVRLVLPVYEQQVEQYIPLCPFCESEICDWGLFGDEVHVEDTCGSTKCEHKLLHQNDNKALFIEGKFYKAVR